MAAPVTLLEPVTGRAAEQPLEYPYSDGKILMETDPHADSIVDMRYQLKTHFEARQDVYVAGSMALYYREGDPAAMLAPDLFVVLGVEKKERRSYMLWEEGGVVPAFVVEVASRSTSRLDATSKRATYERMGVREYWRFDPLGELIREGLVGWRLADGSYEQVRAGRAGSWQRSEALGLELRAEGRLLRFWDPQQGRALATHSESLRALQAAERKHDQAAQQRDQLAQQRDQLAQQLDRAAQQRDQLAQERDRAAQERDRAAQERNQAQQKIRELEARLRSLGMSG